MLELKNGPSVCLSGTVVKYLCALPRRAYREVVPTLRRIRLEVGNYEFDFSQLSDVLERSEELLRETEQLCEMLTGYSGK